MVCYGIIIIIYTTYCRYGVLWNYNYNILHTVVIMCYGIIIYYFLVRITHKSCGFILRYSPLSR